MIGKKKILGLVLARKNSKGLKNKNIKKLGNKHLVGWIINAAKKSKYINRIIVSTESKSYAKIAMKYGAEVPFLRKKKFSEDFTTTEETLKNALSECEKFYKVKFDICVFLSSTNLFRKVSWIKDAVNILKKNDNLESVFSVHRIYKHFWHIQNNKLSKVSKWMNSYTSRQIAPKLFREDTGLASASRATLWRKGKRIGKKVKLIVNDDSFTGIDIHDKKDLELANFAIKYLIRNKLDKDIIT